MIRADEITGLVLAGGKSARMGQDKAMLMLSGKPFIQHIAEVFQSVFAKVFVSANTTEYDFLGLPVVRDIYENYGPLGGIHAGLRSVRTSTIFTAPCDVPLFNSSIVETLLASAPPGVIAIASSAERLQPLVGVYPVSCRSGLEAFLASGQRKVQDFLATVPYVTVCCDALGKKLKNINNEGQYRDLKRH